MSAAKKPVPEPLPRRDRGVGVRFDAKTLGFLRRLAVDHAEEVGGRPSVSEIIARLVHDHRDELVRQYRPRA